MASKKYQVELTLNEIVAIRDVIAAAHADQGYTAGDNLADAEAGDYASWKPGSIKSAREKQAHLSKLHEALTGEALTPTPEKDPKPVEVDA